MIDKKIWGNVKDKLLSTGMPLAYKWMDVM
jgi:hypothetical protein